MCARAFLIFLTIFVTNAVHGSENGSGKSQGGGCILPSPPKNGRYIVNSMPDAKQGQSFPAVALNISCDPGYSPSGSPMKYCVDGVWSENVTDCIRYCRLVPDSSVTYLCLTSDEGYTRPCNEFVPDGTLARPMCNVPNYYSTGLLPDMRCIDGNWDLKVICTPECGRVSPRVVSLILDGHANRYSDTPWYAGVYSKASNPFKQICGGSLVSTKVVISAAHCFWDETLKLKPAANYAVALGKLYRPFNDKSDSGVQTSDVEDIKIPIRFQGGATNYEADIALVMLSTVINYKPNIRPVCVDFNINFEKYQLQPGKIGELAGWGLNGGNRKETPTLKVIKLPAVTIDECLVSTPVQFREFITGDKFCAGYRNGNETSGTAPCRGDGGGGLTFPSIDRGVTRHYLRGVLSTTLTNENTCNVAGLTTFTMISRHEHFIKEQLV